MFTVESFNDQIDDLLARICEELQLSETKFKIAEGRYHAVGEWLGAEGSPLAAFKPKIYAQGSARIGTTVSPLHRAEFDLDLVCEFLLLDWRKVPNPVLLLDAIEARLKQNEMYKDMVERKNRCIRLNYANEFHLDILPACPDSTGSAGCLLVPDRQAQTWKASNPQGYAAWFEAKAALALREAIAKYVEPLPDHTPAHKKETLKLAVQLLKRWRDIHYDGKPDGIAPISIVLTTLAAERYSGQRSVNETLTCFLDGIIGDLPPTGSRLHVLNPTNTKEDLSERWDENAAAYPAFVSGIQTLRESWREVNGRQGTAKVTSLLESLFGETVTRQATVKQAEAFQKARLAGRVGTTTGAGILTGLTSVKARAIPPNTFHGD